MSKFQKKIAIWIAAILVPVVANAFKAGDTIRVQMGKVYSGVDYGDYIDFVWIPESMVSEKRKEAGFWKAYDSSTDAKFVA